VLVLALAAAACAVAAAPAGATNECRGLQVCVPIAGPWVLAPASGVQFQLACPRRFIVGGLDAELTSRGIDVGFVGSLGSPVNPGITTSTSAVFLGRLLRGRDPVPSFRPHIGCVPASGAGQRTPTAFHPFPPGKPSDRRIVQLAVRAGKTLRYIARCPANERLTSVSHAVGFYSDAPPSAALARAVQVTQQGARLTIRASRAVAHTVAVVQVDLLCVAAG
jgi:hypothetical protein